MVRRFFSGCRAPGGCHRAEIFCNITARPGIGVLDGKTCRCTAGTIEHEIGSVRSVSPTIVRRGAVREGMRCRNGTDSAEFFGVS